jgi:hypothetical protein
MALFGFTAMAIPGSTALSPVTESPVWHASSTGANDSRNWSGYVAKNGTFTAVTGTWTVPSSPMGSGTDAVWVGIGGDPSHDLIQAGTEDTTGRLGQAQHQAWIEMLPRASQTVNLAVNGGDSMSVTIAQQSAGQWQITIKNNTSGQQYQTSAQYASTLSSADWIVEAPTGRLGLLPLDNFGSVSFTGASTTVNGQSESLAQASAQPLTMVGAGNRSVATPSAVGADGQSFSVSYSAGTVTVPPVTVQPQPGGGFEPRPVGRFPFPFERGRGRAFDRD